MALTLGGAVARKSGGVAVPDLLDDEFLGFGQTQVGWDVASATLQFRIGVNPFLLFAADLLELRRGTNPQRFYLYNTYTDVSNYERFTLGWESNVFVIRMAKAGTGTTRNVALYAANSWTFYSTVSDAAIVVDASANAGSDAALSLKAPTGRSGQINFSVSGTEYFRIGGSENSLSLLTNNGSLAARWHWTTTGHFIASIDNSYDIGAAGATRPRNVYVATDVVAGRNVLVSAGGYVGGIDGTAANPVFSTGTGGMYRDGSGRLSFTTNLSGASFAIHHTLGIDVNVAMNINDVNLVLGTTTGTKIGTATSQKLGFYNATPVTQRTKAGHNNWAALSDVVTALVELGLFDQA